ncbi:MAG: radical SAM protein [Thermodesulfobacteria bacterium]|nr:radical SAM protein [Thermodesulfobacteriota bacterium]
MIKKIRKWFYFLFYSWDWIQIEPTSACPHRCIYCPREVYSSSWKLRFLGLSLFKKLIYQLKKFSSVRLIHIQGWGEPFLHPNLLEMISIAKKCGFVVGTTTSGISLKTEFLEKLIDSKIDILAFSLAGFQKRNDSIRVGTEYKKVLKIIETLIKIKEKVGSPTPKIHIAYMWLKSNYKDLKQVLSDLKLLDISQVVIHTLSFVTKKELEKEVIYPEPEILDFVKELSFTYSSEEPWIYIYLPKVGVPLSKCPENIEHACFISADGKVAPCVFHQIPVTEPVTYYFTGKELTYFPFDFGNIIKEDIYTLWSKKHYKNFRKSFLSHYLCSNCYKPYFRYYS